MSVLAKVQRGLARQRANAHLNAFISVQADETIRSRVSELDKLDRPGPLHGTTIAVKDNICTSCLPTTAASRILAGFRSPFNASVVDRLHDAGTVLVGKTNLDEFGMGSHSIYSAHGPVFQQLLSRHHPSHRLFSAGGSSGGSAVAVAVGIADAALGTDTGGSVRLPAAYTGLVGFKPTYGLLSRWGVIAYANSLDTVGILARDVAQVTSLFDVLNKHDPQDSTSLSDSTRRRLTEAATAARCADGKQMDDSDIVVGVPEQYVVEELDPLVRAGWERALERVSQRGWKVKTVSLPTTQMALAAYYVLAPAEASSNLARFDGVRFGRPYYGQAETNSIESPAAARSDSYDADANSPLYSATRGHGFGAEVQRRILLGTYSLHASAMDNYFIQAQRVRRMVQQDFDRVFRIPNVLIPEEDRVEAVKAQQVDVLLTPTAPTLPPLLDEVQRQSSVDGYLNDVFTVPASLAGLPAVTVPADQWTRASSAVTGADTDFGALLLEERIGIQVVGQVGDDDMILRVARVLEGSA